MQRRPWIWPSVELRRSLLVMWTYPLARKGAYASASVTGAILDCNLLHRKVLMSHYQQRMAQAPVFAGWSSGGAKPFRELDLAEAALRAGVELAKLTELPAGPLSAPALLDALLSGAGHDPQKMLQIGATVEAADMQWRNEWAPDIVGTPVELLCPVTLAAALAAASDDQADWKQRFYRESGLRATAKLPSRALAEQVHRERLLLRLCMEQEA